MGESLTGRSDKSAEVYANFDKVDDVENALQTIIDSDIENAKSEINGALKELNSAKGFEYVAKISSSSFDTLFTGMTESVKGIRQVLRGNADEIKRYESSSLVEKIFSTASMTLCKLGEGLLGIVDDIGDGLTTVVGWVGTPVAYLFGGEDSVKGWQKGVGDVAKVDWSHDAFNFYYKSDFAKASAYTEDSGIGNGVEIVGTAVGYIALAAATAGAGSAIAGGGAATAAAGAATTAAGTFASSTTIANTAIAAIGGLGSGTEGGLIEGKDFGSASIDGIKQGAIQGALAFAGGKIGEKMAKTRAVKAATANVEEAQAGVAKAQSALDKADDAFKKAGDDLVNPDIAKGYAQNSYEAAMDTKIAAKKSLEEATDKLTNATTKLENAKNAKLSSFQGYSDKITNKFYEKGENLGNNIVEKGFAKGNGIKANTKAVVQGTKQTASTAAKNTINTVKETGTKIKNAGSTFKDTLKTNIQENSLKHAEGSGINARAVRKGIVKTGSQVVEKVKEKASTSVSNLGITKGEGIINNAKTVAQKINPAKAVQKISPVTTSASVPGLAAQTANAIRGFHEGATEQFTSSVSAPNVTVTSSNKKSSTQKPIQVSGGGSSSGGSTGGKTSTGGGSTGGGSTGGSSTGGGTTGGSSTGGSSSSSPTTTVGTVSTGGKATTTKTVKTSTTSGKTSASTPKKSDTQFKIEADNSKKSEEPSKELESTLSETPQTTPEPIIPETVQDQSPIIPESTDNSVDYNSGYNSGVVQHTGGGYSGSGYVSDTDMVAEADAGASPSDTSGLTPIDESLADVTTSIDDIVKGSKYTKIPTSSKPISATSKSGGSGSSAVIPIAAGLSAAAAAGIGAKAYMDRKKNNDVDEEEDDNFETEEWSGEEDNSNIKYDESSDTQVYLDEDDDYSYQDDKETYDARTNDELADLQ